MPTLHLDTLTCTTSEDWSFDQDEPKIVVNGKTVWTAVVMEGNSYDVSENVKFSGEARVTLIERDGGPDADDFLGEHVVTKGSGTMKFTKDGADYSLTYSVD